MQSQGSCAASAALFRSCGRYWSILRRKETYCGISTSARDGFFLNLITPSREDMWSWSPICNRWPKVCYCHNLYKMILLYVYLRPWNIVEYICLDLEDPEGDAQRVLSFVLTDPLVLSKRRPGQLCRWRALYLVWARVSIQLIVNILKRNRRRDENTDQACRTPHINFSPPWRTKKNFRCSKRFRLNPLRKMLVYPRGLVVPLSAYLTRHSGVSFPLTNTKVHDANVNWSWWI